MDEELVSVIIPTYNMVDFVFQAIDSVLAQTYPRVEIIVVDDGSTDGTLDEFRKKYVGKTSKYPIKVIQKPNGRTGSALNEGIRDSSGKWVHWLSADDIMMPSCIEKMLIHIKQHTEEQQKNSIFYSNYYIVDKDGNKIRDWIEPDRSDKPLEELQREMIALFYGNGSTSMIRKEVFEKVGLFREDLPYFEDYDFWLRACVVYNIRMIGVPEFTIQYRQHDNQLSKKIDLSWNDRIRKHIMELKNGKQHQHPTLYS